MGVKRETERKMRSKKRGRGKRHAGGDDIAKWVYNDGERGWVLRGLDRKGGQKAVLVRRQRRPPWFRST